MWRDVMRITIVYAGHAWCTIDGYSVNVVTRCELFRGGTIQVRDESPRGDVMRTAPLRGLRCVVSVSSCTKVGGGHTVPYGTGVV